MNHTHWFYYCHPLLYSHVQLLVGFLQTTGSCLMWASVLLIFVSAEPNTGPGTEETLFMWLFQLTLRSTQPQKVFNVSSWKAVSSLILKPPVTSSAGSRHGATISLRQSDINTWPPHPNPKLTSQWWIISTGNHFQVLPIMQGGTAFLSLMEQ